MSKLHSLLPAPAAKFLVSTYYMLNTMIGARDTTFYKMETLPSKMLHKNTLNPIFSLRIKKY